MSEEKIDIPVQQTDVTIFDDAICSVKEKFMTEMRKIDEEMNKFSFNLMHLYAQPSTVPLEAASASESSERQTPSKGCSWESLTRSPLVEGEGESKSLKLQFDVSQFDPTEVSVEIQNELLMVSALHAEQSDNSSVVRQLYREFKFPKGVDPCAVNSTLSKDGVLTVQAPLPLLAITDESERCVPNSLDII